MAHFWKVKKRIGKPQIMLVREAQIRDEKITQQFNRKTRKKLDSNFKTKFYFTEKHQKPRIGSALMLLLLFSFQTATGQINEAFKFKVTSPNLGTDETVLRFHQDATASFDGAFDAWKMFTWNDSIPSLFTNTQEGGMLSINSINFPAQDTSMAVNMKVPLVSGQYTFETEALGQHPNNLKLAILDLETGVSHSIEDGASFSFDVTANPTDMIERFELFISTNSYALVNSDEVTFVNNGCYDWTLKVMDENSQIILDQAMTEETFLLESLNEGTYTGMVIDNFGITDIISFEILVDEDEESEGNYVKIDKSAGVTLSSSLKEVPEIRLIEESGDSVLLVKGTQVSRVNVYSINGGLIDVLTSLHEGKNIIQSYNGITILQVIHTSGEVVIKKPG